MIEIIWPILFFIQGVSLGFFLGLSIGLFLKKEFK